MTLTKSKLSKGQQIGEWLTAIWIGKLTVEQYRRMMAECGFTDRGDIGDDVDKYLKGQLR